VVGLARQETALGWLGLGLNGESGARSAGPARHAGQRRDAGLDDWANLSDALKTWCEVARESPPSAAGAGRRPERIAGPAIANP